MTKPVLALDCDGVLYALDQYVLDTHVNPQLGTSYTPADIRDWNWSTMDPAAGAIFKWSLYQADTWDHGKAYPGVAADVRELADHYTIAIITAMPGKFAPQRAAWLTGHDIPGKLIIASNKAKQAKEIKAIAAVEDYASNANAYGAQNIPCWLVTKPYNEFVYSGINVERGTWTEGVAWLLRLAANIERRVAA